MSPLAQNFMRFRPNFLSHVKSIYIPECIHKCSRSKNNLEPLNSIRALRAPPMNLSGPGGPWQIGLKKGERIASVGFGQISNFFIRPIEIHHNNQTMHIVYLHFHWDSRGVSAKSKKKSNFAWNTRDFMALNKCTRPS